MGDNDTSRQFDESAGNDFLRLRTSLLYGFSPSTRWWSEDKQVPPEPEGYRVDLHLVSLIANADLRTGTALGLVLPWGVILRMDRDPDQFDKLRHTTDVGVGDLELRVRQEVLRPLLSLFDIQGKGLPRLVVSAGAITPTGPYIPKKNIVWSDTPAPETDKYASLGRGVWWLAADAELFGQFSERFGWYTALYTRTALTTAQNGFEWGAERRTALGGSWRALPELLTVSLAADWQWRDKSWEQIEVEPGVFERTQFISGGGHWVDLVPTVRVDITQRWAATASVRQPLWRYVHGTQGIQDTSYFVGIQHLLGVGANPPSVRVEVPRPASQGDRPLPEIAKLLKPGQVTLVDYWATWCEPCERLGKELDAFVAGRPDVALARVDVTEWSQAQMDRVLPAVAGVPVVDVWGPDGTLQARLVGPECFDFRAKVPAPAVDGPDQGEATPTAR